MKYIFIYVLLYIKYVLYILYYLYKLVKDKLIIFDITMFY